MYIHTHTLLIHAYKSFHRAVLIPDNILYYFQIQIYLYSQLATEFCMQPLGGTGLDLRDIMTVSYLVHSLKEHYSLVDTNTGNEEIRQYVLLIIKQFTTRVRAY